MTPKPKAGKPTREDRLAAALRENLKRRKQAARAASRPAPEGPGEAAPERPNTAQKPG